MIQNLLFAETVGFEEFDVTKTQMSLGGLVEEYLKKEAFGFEQKNRCESSRLGLITFSKFTDLTSSNTEAFRRSNQAQRDEQTERAKTLEKWYGLQKKEMTKDLENELSILRLRRYMHKTSFVKTADFKTLPKYFAVLFLGSV